MSATVRPTRRRLIRGAAALLGVAAAGAAAGGIVMARGDLGGTPAGERLRRMMSSPNWRDGAFRNPVPLERSASGRSRAEIMRDFLLDRNPARFPSGPIPSVAANLAALPDDRFVWLGHSGFLLNFAGSRILIDPALHQAFPVPGFYRPFAGADRFAPEDLPAADAVLITHDHYDHLDCRTVRALRGRVRLAVCPLGVGAHFEAWGWEPGRIAELDWHERVRIGGVTVTAVPAQHFSGRSLTPNPTLWAGYVLEAGGFCIHHSGDTGRGPHFAEIARAFPKIDLSLLEDGQYDADWPGVHLLPEAWREAVETLRPEAVMPIHNAKYCLSHHAWTDPLEAARKTAEATGIRLLQPMVGEPVALDPALRPRVSECWWRGVG